MYSLTEGEAGLARVLIAMWLREGSDPKLPAESFENAMAMVPDDIILGTEEDDKQRIAFLRFFAVAVTLAENAYGAEAHGTVQ